MDIIERSYNQLIRSLVERDLAGYDPYDGANTEWAFLSRIRSLRIAQTYIHKFCPWNLRYFFRIRPRQFPQATAGVVRAIIERPGAGRDSELIRKGIDYLNEKSLIERWGRHCWNGNDMLVQMRGELQERDCPGVVGTEACARAFLDFYEKKGRDNEIGEILKGVRSFLLENLFTRYESGVFFRYKPITPAFSYTYNASILGAVLIEEINNTLGENIGCNESREAVEDVLARQHPEGFWNYSIDLRSGHEKKQIDFHQGFILNAILRYIDLTGSDSRLLKVYEKGLAFYRNRQFSSDGQGLYRWPRKWPVNIHNQAQGILTFTRAAQFSRDNLRFARRIAEWTIENMCHPDGHFYYLKYPLFTNKIQYIRWSDAAMAYALAVYLSAEGNENKSTEMTGR